jgi:diguanylate cyclase (GGDEF)-like protein/PAS domain S-box-containing protein
MSEDVSVEVLSRRLTRAIEARKAAESLLEQKSLELYNANQELRALNATLEESETRSRKLVELMPEAVLVHTEGRLVFLNEAARRLFGAPTTEDLLGTPLLDRVAPEYHADLLDAIRRVAEQPADTPALTLQMLRLDGSRADVEMTGTAIHYRNAASVLAVARDVTERHQHEAALEHQALHDLLTGLPNRTLLHDRLTQAIRHAERYGTRLGVMFIDLDKFKFINDSMGHSVGDELLRATAARLLECVRDSDTVARLGGDEFVLLIDRVGDESTLPKLAQRTVQTLGEPLMLAGQSHRVTCSIGVSVYPADGQDAEQLLRQADLAMYRAKEAGRNNFQFFTQTMQERLDAHLTLERQLLRALERDEFILHFQPQVALRSGRIVGLEALIRWQSPQLGLVPPMRFIPLAEESNLILAIGEWVLHSACAQLKTWQQRGLAIVPVAVNVAARQFTQQRVDLLTQQALQRHALEPRYLELELTESASMGDPQSTIVWMQRLKEIGVSLAIDDFGTGYSNLSYLKRFPVDKLKIDQAFIRGMTSEPRDHSITTAVIRLARSLGLRTIAEGVETEGQLRLLMDESCDEMQGYYFSPPRPADEIAKMLAAQPRLDLAGLQRRPYQRTVLLIDDEPPVLASFERMLRGEGVELLTADRTEAAYEILARREVGVVVSDHQLPGEDGVSFFARIKQLYPRTVRILLTGHDTPRTLTGAINRGEIYRFIAKPWDDSRVREVLREAAQRYET